MDNSKDKTTSQTVNYGEAIRLIRKKLGISQHELGQRLGGWTAQKVSLYETNKRCLKVTQVDLMAKALNVSTKTFMEYAQFVTRGNIGDVFFLPDVKRNPPESESTGKLGHLVNLFCNQLNATGQNEAVKQVEMLSEIPRYQKESE